MPVLVIDAYRSDGLPRDHMLRWLRNELRRSDSLEELVLAPLGPCDDTAELVADQLGGRASPALVRALHDRTQGLPSSSRSSPARSRSAAGCRPGRADSSSADSATSRFPTRSGTRC